MSVDLYSLIYTFGTNVLRESKVLREGNYECTTKRQYCFKERTWRQSKVGQKCGR